MLKDCWNERDEWYLKDNSRNAYFQSQQHTPNSVKVTMMKLLSEEMVAIALAIVYVDSFLLLQGFAGRGWDPADCLYS